MYADMEQELLRPTEVAERLGLSVTTVYTLLRTGELPSIVWLAPGRAQPRMMVRASVVAEWLAKKPAAGEATK